MKEKDAETYDALCAELCGGAWRNVKLLSLLKASQPRACVERSRDCDYIARASRLIATGAKMLSRAEAGRENWFEECITTLGEVYDESVYGAIERLVAAGSEVALTVPDLIRLLKGGMSRSPCSLSSRSEWRLLVRPLIHGWPEKRASTLHSVFLFAIFVPFTSLVPPAGLTLIFLARSRLHFGHNDRTAAWIARLSSV